MRVVDETNVKIGLRIKSAIWGDEGIERAGNDTGVIVGITKNNFGKFAQVKWDGEDEMCEQGYYITGIYSPELLLESCIMTDAINLTTSIFNDLNNTQIKVERKLKNLK